MRVALASLLALSTATFLACGDGHGHHGMHDEGGGEGEGSACTLLGCNDGVSVQIAGVATKLAADLPIDVHVCVDTTCDDFQVASVSGHPTCNRPPTTQGFGSGAIASCSLRPDGGLDVELTTDAGTFDDRSSHVLAVSLKSGKRIVYEHAEVLALETEQPNGPACEPTCRRASVSLTP